MLIIQSIIGGTPAQQDKINKMNIGNTVHVHVHVCTYVHVQYRKLLLTN